MEQFIYQERFIYQDGIRYNALYLPKDFVIKGDLDLSYMGLTKLPDLSTIRVKGSFYCNDNYLTTLYGSPAEVERNFFAGNNKLHSLEGCTRVIPMVFEVCNNQLETLEYGPEYTGTYLCQKNLESISKAWVAVLSSHPSQKSKKSVLRKARNV